VERTSSQFEESDFKKVEQEANRLIRHPLILKGPGKEISLSPQEIVLWLDLERVEKKEEEILARPSDDFLTYSQELLGQRAFRFETTLSLSFNEEKIKAYLEKLASQINSEPVNAQLTIRDGRATIFVPDQDGRRLKIPEAIRALKEALLHKQGVVDLPVEILKAEVRLETLNDLGIKEKIGEGVSNFAGSPTNRRHNIKVGAQRFNGVLIKPGEIFSFNTHLGPVDASTGYLPELVIKENKTIPEYGGGLCQVATTFFRAAFWAGLPILEREPHAYRVRYYDWPYGPGMDATVYPPHPDVRIKNDTGHWILIQTYLSGNYLHFDFYGTSDGRRVELNGPRLFNQQADGSLDAVAYRLIYDAKGNLLRKDTFKSHYDSPAKYPHPPGQ